MTTVPTGLAQAGDEPPSLLLNILGAASFVMFFLSFGLLVCLIAACQPGHFTVPAPPEAAELIGVPSYEIRLLLTEADGPIFEERSEL